MSESQASKHIKYGRHVPIPNNELMLQGTASALCGVAVPLMAIVLLVACSSVLVGSSTNGRKKLTPIVSLKDSWCASQIQVELGLRSTKKQ